MKKTTEPNKARYTKKEEIANSISHALGILLGIITAFVFYANAETRLATTSVTVYLIGMLSSYICSTLYHAATNTTRKDILRKFDHAAIYIHIAGTYTPFTLLVLPGAWGWGIFAFVWIAALVGIIVSFTSLKEHSNLETICFVAMGCTIFIVVKPLITQLNTMQATASFYWLMGGGLAYILGALFYTWRKVKYMHSIFHLFCLLGSLFHIFAIYKIL